MQNKGKHAYRAQRCGAGLYATFTFAAFYSLKERKHLMI